MILPGSREQRSLFGEILDWMLAPLLLLWPMSVALTWLVAQGIANKPYDRQLGEMVRVLSKQVAIEARGGPPAARFVLPAGAADILHTDEADDIYYQVLGLRGEYLSGEASLPVGRRTVIWIRVARPGTCSSGGRGWAASARATRRRVSSPGWWVCWTTTRRSRSRPSAGSRPPVRPAASWRGSAGMCSTRPSGQLRSRHERDRVK